jgi:sortase (surface protein transpeptidase)
LIEENNVRARNLLYAWLLCLLTLLPLLCGGCGSPPPAAQAATHKKAARGAENNAADRAARSQAGAPTATKPGPPARLMIPTIGLDVGIEQVGILANGDLGTPTQHPWDDAGWYNVGPTPGERGSAVLDGHLDRPGGYPAAFWNLRYLQAGNLVMIRDGLGKTLHFRVSAIVYYAPQAAPIQAIFGNEDGSYLNLITCAGDWIPSQHQTTLRLVVYTTYAP